MTEVEAQAALMSAGRHLGGGMDVTAIPYTCRGGFAVVVPVAEQPDLWYVLTEYHVNIFEDLAVIAAVPPVMHLSSEAVVPYRLRV